MDSIYKICIKYYYVQRHLDFAPIFFTFSGVCDIDSNMAVQSYWYPLPFKVLKQKRQKEEQALSRLSPI